MTVTEFRDLLVELAPDDVQVYHQQAAPEATDPMIVWMEGALRALWADDTMVAQVLPVQVNYYTGVEYDAGPYLLVQRLVENGVSCDLEPTYDVDYDEWVYVLHCEVVA